MSNSRIIGKHTLESLTVGMYADNRIIFREYVQNATDAIDSAVAMGIIEQKDGRIEITIDNKKKEVRIRDNGTGIRAQDVYHILGDIGKSAKRHSENRGFRGIGRLGGLGYCTELQFITSYQGEPCKTVTLWDAKELRRILQPDNNKYEAIIEVIDAVTIQDKHPEKEDEHYFEVVLSGIEEEHLTLLDIEDIRNYLSQVAPVPFDYNQSMELRKINEHLQKLGVSPEEYKVFLNKEQLYKPYRRKMLINDRAKKNKFDYIKDIIPFEGYKNDETLFFAGWYAHTDLSGIIKDDNVSGIRLRKGNILIGGNKTLDDFFGNKSTYQRFNRYFIGEIYIFDQNLIPNARRDDFEKNETYYKFKQEVEKTTHNLALLPHPYSKIRSNETKLQEIPSKIEEIKEEISCSGITDTRKEKIVEQIEDLRRKANNIDPNAYGRVKVVTRQDDSEPSNVQNDVFLKKFEDVKKAKSVLLAKLEELEEEVESSKEYITKQLSSIPRKCRKEIDKIFNVIDRVLDNGLAKDLKAQIIKELQPKTKEKRGDYK